jgi:hypothetical protein
MALDCDDVNARLLDLVYGEGDARERKALQEHVDGCARCRADLEALGRTRATVRARLDDAPPPGARSRILEAAAQAIAAGAGHATAAAAAGAAAAPARTAGPAPRGDGSSSSFWAWLRGRWQLPTFATVGAIAVMLLAAKVILDPRGAYDRGQAVSQSFPAAIPTHVAREPSMHAMAAPASPDLPAAEPVAPKGGHLDGLAREVAPAVPASAPAPRAVTRHHHVVAAAANEKAAPKGSMDDLLEGALSGSKAGPSTSATAGNTGEILRGDQYAERDRKAESDKEFKAPAVAARPQKKAKQAFADEPLAGGGVGSASARAAAAPVAVADEGSVREEAEAKDDAHLARKPAGRVYTAPPPPPAPAAAPVPAQPPSPSMDELARRADRLFADGRWDEAAVAYQELLRRYPTADGAARWRARVGEVNRARVAERAAKRRAPAAAEASPRTEPAEAAPAASSAPAKQ